MYKILTEYLPVLAASMAVSAVAGHYLIPFLRQLKAQQTEREEGPESHKSKTGTPNMGGLMFLFSFLVLCAVCAVRHSQVVPVMILTAGFGMVGFLDDYIKVTHKQSEGLTVWQKFLLQIVIALIFCVYVRNVHFIPLSMKIPFMKGHFLDLGILNIPAMIFVSVATVNGTNFTDGVDALAASVTVAVAAFFLAAGIMIGGGTGEGVAVACAAMIGGLLGFLIYNRHPARVFMGDTGSLALGGFVAGCAYMLQLPLWIPVVGFIYMIEVISVMLQVGYFKMTHGKRLFRMSPIHHHFELGGWSEVKVVAVFTSVTVLLGLLMLPAVW